MPNVRTFTRILDGEHVIGESNRLMSREQALVTTSATEERLPGTALILEGASYRPMVLGDVAGLASNTNNLDLVAFNFVRIRKTPAGASTKRTAIHVRDCRVNGKKIVLPAGASTGQKTAIYAAFKRQNVQVGF